VWYRRIWIHLAGRVNELLAQPKIAGIVVTHGTNTLEETAYSLDLTKVSENNNRHRSATPASDLDSDGPRNLLDAGRVAIAPEPLARA